MQNRRSPMNLFAALLVCIVISACGARATALPSPVPSPTNSQAPTRAAVTRIIMTATPLPQTPSPTVTILSSRTATLLPATTATINANATQRAQIRAVTETALAGFPQTCEGTYSNTESISPGGNWLVSSCGYNRDQSLEIVNREGKWYVLMFKDYLVAEDLKFGVGLGTLYPEQWINDDYLYFTTVLGVSGGGTCFYGFGVNGLHRIDLNTGTVSAILRPRPAFSGYLIAFSPSGRRLVYEEDRSITMLDMKTGEKSSLNHGDGIAGTFTWSPDGKKLAYATCQAKDFSTIVKSTVQIYDLETGKTDVILELLEHHLAIERWGEEGVMKIEDANFVDQRVDYWYFDWNAGQVSQPTLVANP